MKIGYAYVVGDILHIGHIIKLRTCKRMCDKLIVGVLSDAAAAEKNKKPIMPLIDRMIIFEALEDVDMVVVQETYSPIPNIRMLKPDILFESPDHDAEDIESSLTEMKTLRGKLVMTPYYSGQSSTKIKEEIYEQLRSNPKQPVKK